MGNSEWETDSGPLRFPSLDTDSFTSLASSFGEASSSSQSSSGSLPRHSGSRHVSPLLNEVSRVTDNGANGTPGYCMRFLDRKGWEISPLHGLPLHASDSLITVVCKTPRGAYVELECASIEEGEGGEGGGRVSGSRSEVEFSGKLPPGAAGKGELEGVIGTRRGCGRGGFRVRAAGAKPSLFSTGAPCNYGMLPQTWANSELPNLEYGGLPYNGRPMEVLEIGAREARVGEIYAAKVLGAFALIEFDRSMGQLELSWKVLAIRADDACSGLVESAVDLPSVLPGITERLREWLRMCRCSRGDGTPNVFGLNERVASRENALKVVQEAHASWQLLVNRFPRLLIRSAPLYPPPSPTSASHANHLLLPFSLNLPPSSSPKPRRTLSPDSPFDFDAGLISPGASYRPSSEADSGKLLSFDSVVEEIGRLELEEPSKGGAAMADGGGRKPRSPSIRPCIVIPEPQWERPSSSALPRTPERRSAPPCPSPVLQSGVKTSHWPVELTRNALIGREGSSASLSASDADSWEADGSETPSAGLLTAGTYLADCQDRRSQMIPCSSDRRLACAQDATARDRRPPILIPSASPKGVPCEGWQPSERAPSRSPFRRGREADAEQQARYAAPFAGRSRGCLGSLERYGLGPSSCGGGQLGEGAILGGLLSPGSRRHVRRDSWEDAVYGQGGPPDLSGSGYYGQGRESFSGRSRSPQPPTPGSRSQRYATPPRYASPSNASPRHATSPRYATPPKSPKYSASPRYTTPPKSPKYSASPRYTTPPKSPRYSASPGNATLSYATPRHATSSRYATPPKSPRYATSPRYASPSNATPSYATSPRYATPPKSPRFSALSSLPAHVADLHVQLGATEYLHAKFDSRLADTRLALARLKAHAATQGVM